MDRLGHCAVVAGGPRARFRFEGQSCLQTLLAGTRPSHSNLGRQIEAKPISCASPGFRSHMACSLDQRRRASEVLVFGSRCCGTPKPPSPCSHGHSDLYNEIGAALGYWSQRRQRADSVFLQWRARCIGSRRNTFMKNLGTFLCKWTLHFCQVIF